MISPADSSLLLAFSAALASLVASVVVLRVFFTFWGPLDRKLNGRRSSRSAQAELDVSMLNLKGSLLNVYLSSGAVLAGVVLVGLHEADDHDFYEINPLFVMRGLDGREYLVRAEKIEYFERALSAPTSEPPPALGSGEPDPDAPENWQVGA